MGHPLAHLLLAGDTRSARLRVSRKAPGTWEQKDRGPVPAAGDRHVAKAMPLVIAEPGDRGTSLPLKTRLILKAAA